MAKEWTKGSWRVSPSSFDGKMVEQTDVENRWGIYIADCRMTDEGAANARLIAAAPDLYEALKGILDNYEQGFAPDVVEIDLARAALSKAEGR